MAKSVLGAATTTALPIFVPTRGTPPKPQSVGSPAPGVTHVRYRVAS